MKLKITMLVILFCLFNLNAQTDDSKRIDTVSINKKLLKKIKGNWKGTSIKMTENIIDCENFKPFSLEESEDGKTDSLKIKKRYNKTCNKLKQTEFTISNNYFKLNTKQQSKQNKKAFIIINNKLEKDKILIKRKDTTEELYIELIDNNTFKFRPVDREFWIKFKRVQN